MIVSFAHNLRAEFQEELDSVERGILSGAAKDFEEYRHLVGKKLGLEKSLALLDDAVRRFDERN